MAIRIEGLNYSYLPGTPWAVTALQDVSLSVAAGGRLGVAGRSGSGKSTLLQHLNGLLRPTAGRVLIAGGDAAGRDRGAGRRLVGLLPQNPQQHFFEPTVRREIGFALAGERLSATASEQRIREVLALVGLPAELLDVSPFRLSSGDQRRVALAGVLIGKPAILVLDEPTAGLDPRGRRTFLATIDRLQRELGWTLVLASHRSEELIQLTDRMAVLREGRVMACGLTPALLGDPEVRQSAGLVMTPVASLLAELRKEWPELPAGIQTAADAHRVLHEVLLQRSGGRRRVA